MRPNILFLIIDSFRADKFYNKNKTSQTPNIDFLINNGIYFEQAISAADATILSETSIFTGKFPFKTGIRSERFNKLNNKIITLFDILKEHNYNFYGYIPTISKTLGLFPTFENQEDAYESEPNLNNNLGAKIIKKLQSNHMKEPWFFCIHFMDLHFPITVPNEFDNEKFGLTNYEKQVSSIDNWIGKILKLIDLKNTLLIITADHGEYIKHSKIDSKEINLEESGTIEVTKRKLGRIIPNFLNPLKDRVFFSIEESKQKKKSKMLENLNLKPHERRALMAGRYQTDHVLFDDKLRIPLLFAGFGIKNGKILPQQVRSVDIFPTIFELIGIPNLSHKIDGVSLVPLIEEKKINELPAYIESNPLVQLQSNDVIGIRTSKYKYFRDRDDPKKRIHLFDLENDPFEDKNLENIERGVVNNLENILQEILNDDVSNEQTKEDQSDEIERELRKLGYV